MIVFLHSIGFGIIAVMLSILIFASLIGKGLNREKMIGIWFFSISIGLAVFCLTL